MKRFLKRHWPALLLLLIPFGFAAYSFWFELGRLIVRNETIDLPTWKQRPLRVALVSDLHTGSPRHGLSQLARIVDEINEQRPDAVVLLGDYVIQGVKGGTFVPPEKIARELGRLRSPLGTFAVLGNHDHWLDADRVESALTSHQIRVLEDQTVRVTRANESFWIVGISDFWEGKHEVTVATQHLDKATPAIAITHNPDLFPSIPPRIALTLAGHTHGGQVFLPLIGRPVVPSQFGKRYAIGHIIENSKHLYVTSGTGTSILPIRFRVPPEIVLLTIE